MDEKGSDGKSNMTPVSAEVLAPIIVPLGKMKKKEIKRLEKGRGKAMDEVADVIEQVQAKLGEQADGKAILPVIVVYRKKQRRFRRWF